MNTKHQDRQLMLEAIQNPQSQQILADYFTHINSFGQDWDWHLTTAEIQRALSYAYSSKVFFKDGNTRDRASFVQQTMAALEMLRLYPRMLEDVLLQPHLPSTEAMHRV